MGRKGNWFSSVKKALSPESKKREEDQKPNKSKKKWFGKQKLQQTSDSYLETDKAPPLPPPEEPILTNIENENNHVHVVEVATVSDTKEPLPAVHTPPVPVLAPIIPRVSGKLNAEVAAIKIQTAFRGYLARRALRALRGLDRLKSLMEGPVVKRQAASTLRSMQTLSRLQSQIHTRRIKMLEENQAIQRQFLQKHAKEVSMQQMGDEWDDSLQSKEQIEAKLLGKYEATVRRERAMAYAFSHQKNGKNSSRSINPVFMDPTNPAWGWSWLERWMAARPWESKEANDQSSVKSSSRSISAGEITKSFARYQINSEKLSPTASQNPGSPSFHSHSTPSKPPASSSASASKKLKKVSPKDTFVIDDDSKSMVSVQSGFRRHSIAGSSVRDDESLASSPAVPSYMVPTQSAKAKSRTQSPLVIENNGTIEKGSSGTAKKRLSFPSSPASRPRRHSGPPKVESSFSAEVTVGNGVAG
ncbi:protein IQ-DOMAIN 1 [Senna tora]|uniref:Protein IQ-DOMAIN 1 n=1 Tax=Senna tora TaxID=362788 RepID=A0A834W3J9_9FABA|nr:protein IQ-DOMAIN 1 [Senna tora]